MDRLENAHAMILEHTVPDAPLRGVLVAIVAGMVEQRRGIDALTEQIEALQETLSDLHERAL